MPKPGSFANKLPRGEGWVVETLAEIQTKIRESAAARTLQSAVISAGGLLIKAGGGITIRDGGNLEVLDGGGFFLTTPSNVPIFSASQADIPDGSGRTQQSLTMARDDSTTAFALGDFGTVPNHPHQQDWAWYDRQTNIVFAEDTESGFGLAVPNLPVGTFVDISVPTNTTTSPTFTPMQWADSILQHPYLQCAVLVYAPSGTLGEFRFTVAGQQIGTPVAFGNASAVDFQVYFFGPFPWPTAAGVTFGLDVVLGLEFRVTSGAGAVGGRALSAWGVGTP